MILNWCINKITHLIEAIGPVCLVSERNCFLQRERGNGTLAEKIRNVPRTVNNFHSIIYNPPFLNVCKSHEADS